ncbi:hypothetical protein DMUE_1144 [Dictyocoela muelleri]|nr:hypothetical protein DMUE_1144 [Dictyocoela muelleri]
MKVLEAIPEYKICNKCNREMRIRQTTKYNFVYCWKCSKSKVTSNILSDCSLADKKITHFIFFKFAFYFFNKTHFSASYIMQNCEISEDMYKNLLQLIREKISCFVKENQRPLGNVLKGKN